MKSIEFLLTEERKAIVELIRDIKNKINPQDIKRWDRDEEFAKEAVELFKEAELFKIPFPREYGGLGLGIFELCLAIEEISKICSGIATIYAGSILGALPILLFGTKEQKEKYLKEASEGKLFAFCLTEAEAGSDAAAIKTSAKKENKKFILEGTKQWVTNAGVADYYLVFAQSNPEKGIRGMSCFIVSAYKKGVNFSKKESKLGIRASQTGEMVFDSVELSEDELVGGKEGRGYIIALKSLDLGRIGVGAQALGIAQRAFEIAFDYATKRTQFNQKIISFQTISHKLADMATKIEAMRALVYNIAQMMDNGNISSKLSSMAKVFCSDSAVGIVIDAMQVFGGYSYSKDYEIEKLYRDIKITQIFEGTNEIQRNIIANELQKRVHTSS